MIEKAKEEDSSDVESDTRSMDMFRIKQKITQSYQPTLISFDEEEHKSRELPGAYEILEFMILTPAIVYGGLAEQISV